MERTPPVIFVDPVQPELDRLEQAADLLRRGRLVAFPTETVYGLGAHALDRAAVRRIFEAKGRPATNPLIVHIATIAEARRLARVWSPAAEALATHFWPGPLTIVVPGADIVPAEVSAGLDTVALRLPGHPVARALLRTAGIPLAAPSANRYTEVSPTTADHVLKSLGTRVDMIIDGGPTNVGIESTVISVTQDYPVILRPGMIGEEELRAILPEVVAFDGATVMESTPRHSPGLAPRHYAPRAKLVLVKASRPEFEARIRERCPKERMGIIAIGNELGAGLEDVPVVLLANEPEAYARHLYGALHELDGYDLETILLEAPPEDDPWRAIWDRLRRASTPQQ
ncbi:MAG: L-threonylcarbamoyladenylate synthase [Bradymonadaceae bacterium]